MLTALQVVQQMRVVGEEGCAVLLEQVTPPFLEECLFSNPERSEMFHRKALFPTREISLHWMRQQLHLQILVVEVAAQRLPWSSLAVRHQHWAQCVGSEGAWR